MRIAVFFSGRIRGYEYCIENILKLKEEHDIVFFCSLNLEKLTDYEHEFLKLCDMSPQQYRNEAVQIESWIYDNDVSYMGCNRENMYSQLYNNKKCYELIEEYEKRNKMRFDCIMKYRGDIVSSDVIKIPNNLEENKLYTPNTNVHWGMNDQIGWGHRM
jgi:hypothetical protein